MNPCGVHRLPATLAAAAWIAALICAPVSASAPPSPADSARYCALLDEEPWLREPPPAAGKGSAELNAGEPGTVRMIYFLPNDRPYRQSVVDSMKKVMLKAQALFAEQMAAHGYGPMTFRYEADAAGEPLVHRLDAEHDDAAYRGQHGRSPGVETEVYRAYERTHHVYLVVVDINSYVLASGYAGIAWGRKYGGMAEVPATFDFVTVVHELAHAFGLAWHDFRDDAYILSYGAHALRLSSCSAGYLSVTPWFNPDISPETDWPQVTSIEFVGSSRWYPAGSRQVTVPLRVGDPDGVHQVLLFPDVRGGRTLTVELGSCRMLAGQTEADVTFEYDGVFAHIPNSSLSDLPSHRFWVIAVDRNGNRSNTSLVLAQESPYHVSTLIVPSRSYVDNLALSPDGGLLAVAVEPPAVSLWDVASRREVAAWGAHRNSILALAFSPDGRTLATGSWNQIKLWDVASRQEVAVMEWHSIFGLVDEMSFSPDGTKLASAARDSMVRLWDVASRQEIAVLEGHRGAVDCVAFSPDGAILASGSSDRTIRLWDAARREEVAVLEGHGHGVGSVAFTPDGSILVSGSADGTVRLWDVASRSEFAVLEARWGSVHDVSIFPDGGAIAAASRHQRVDLWDVVSGELLETFGNPGTCEEIALSSDGRILAAQANSGIDNARIELWDTSSFTSRRSGVPDFDGDGAVGFFDFIKFVRKFGYSRGQAGYDPRYDLDGNGDVGFSDFLIFANAFGQSPTGS